MLEYCYATGILSPLLEEYQVSMQFINAFGNDMLYRSVTGQLYYKHGKFWKWLPVLGLPRIRAVYCSHYDNYLLTERGEVYRFRSGLCQHLPLPIPMASLVVGKDHLFAVTQYGEVYARGANECGQLGVRDRHLLLWKQVSLPAPVKKMVTGHEHTLLLARDGTLYGIGANIGRFISTEVSAFVNFTEWQKLTTPVTVVKDIVINGIATFLCDAENKWYLCTVDGWILLTPPVPMVRMLVAERRHFFLSTQQELYEYCSGTWLRYEYFQVQEVAVINANNLSILTTTGKLWYCEEWYQQRNYWNITPST